MENETKTEQEVDMVGSVQRTTARKTSGKNTHKDPHAVALGKMARGKPKRYSKAERLRRAQRMRAMNRARRVK